MEPAALEEILRNFQQETDVKIKKEIQAVCAAYGDKSGWVSDTWEELARD